MNATVLVIVMAAMTMLLRFLPFILFGRGTPRYITYIGKVLPAAAIGMLVVYCLRNTEVIAAPHGAPEFISLIIVVLLQAWKRNTIISILAGTVVYMLLVQLVFV